MKTRNSRFYLFFASAVAFLAVFTAALSTFAWFQIKTSESPSTSVTTGGVRTDAFVYNKEPTHSNDDLTNQSPTEDTGGSLDFDHSKGSKPVDWYIVINRGGGELSPSDSVQMYTNKNNLGDVAAYYKFHFYAGDDFKIVCGSRSEWLGFESLNNGSAYYTGYFSGVTDTAGEKRIHCDAECVADIFVNNQPQILIQKHSEFDEDVKLQNGVGYYVVGTGSNSNSLFYDKDFDIHDGFIMNYDTNVKSLGYEGGYYGLHLYPDDKILVWDGNGENGWYQWDSRDTTNSNALGLFEESEVSTDASGSENPITYHSFKCVHEGYYDIFVNGVSGESYTHHIIINRHVKGSTTSGQGATKAARVPTRAASVTSATGYIRIYFYENEWTGSSGPRISKLDLKDNYGSSWEMNACSVTPSIAALGYGSDKAGSSGYYYYDVPSDSTTQTLYFTFDQGSSHVYKTNTGYQGNLATSFKTGYVYLLKASGYSGADGDNKWCDISEDEIGCFAGFNANGGTNPGSFSRVEAWDSDSNGSTPYSMTTLASPTISGYYSFAGWKVGNTDTTVNGSTSTTISSPTVFTAQWDEITYNATIYVYNGNASLGNFSVNGISANSSYYPSQDVSDLLSAVESSLSAETFRLDGYFTSSTFDEYYVATAPTANFNLYARLGPLDQGFAADEDIDVVGNLGVEYAVVGHSSVSGSDLYGSYWKFDHSVQLVQHSGDYGAAFISLKAGDQFKIRSRTSDVWYGWSAVQSGGAYSSFETGSIGNSTGNIKCKTNGTYAVVLSTSGNITLYSIHAKPGYYLVGSQAAMGSWARGDTNYYRYSPGLFGAIELAVNDVFKVYFLAYDYSKHRVDEYYCGHQNGGTDGALIGSVLAGDAGDSTHFDDDPTNNNHNLKCLVAGTYKISATAALGSPNTATITFQLYDSSFANGYYLVGAFNSWSLDSDLYSATLPASFADVTADALSLFEVRRVDGGFIESYHGWTSSSNTTYLVSSDGNVGSKVKFRYGGTFTITFDASHNFGVTSAELDDGSFTLNGNTSSTFTRDSEASNDTTNVFKCTTTLDVGEAFQIDATDNDAQAYGHWGWNNLDSSYRSTFYEGSDLIDSTHDSTNHKICSELPHTLATITFTLEASPQTQAISISFEPNDVSSYAATQVNNPTGIYFAWRQDGDYAFTTMGGNFNKIRMNYDADKANDYQYGSGDWESPLPLDKKATVKVTLTTDSYCSVLHNLDDFVSLYDTTCAAIKRSGAVVLQQSAGREETNTFFLEAGTYIIYLFGQYGKGPHYKVGDYSTYKVVAKAVTTLIDTTEIHEVPVYAVGRGMPGSVLQNGDYTTTKVGESTFRYIPFFAAANQDDFYPCYASAGPTTNNGVTLKAGDHFIFSDGVHTKPTITNTAGSDYIDTSGSEIVVKVSGVYKIDATIPGGKDQTFANAEFEITRMSSDPLLPGNDSTLLANDNDPYAYSKQHGVRVLNASGSTLNFGGALDISLFDTNDVYASFVIELRHINKNAAGKIDASFAAALPTGVEYRYVYGTQAANGTDVSAFDNTVSYSSWQSSTSIYSEQNLGVNTAANTAYDTCYAGFTLIEIRVPYSLFSVSGDLATYNFSFSININFTENAA